jgi:hypothetical protein
VGLPTGSGESPGRPLSQPCPIVIFLQISPEGDRVGRPGLHRQ